MPGTGRFLHCLVRPEGSPRTLPGYGRGLWIQVTVLVAQCIPTCGSVGASLCRTFRSKYFSRYSPKTFSTTANDTFLGDGFLRRRSNNPDRKSTRLNSSHLVISYAV